MKLVKFNHSYAEAVSRYVLNEEQLKYTITPQESIALSEQDTNRHSILALEGDEVICYFALQVNEGISPYSQNPQATLFRSFSTAFAQQGKGYAKRALKLLPEFVRENYPDINCIVLAVNVANLAAQNLYRQCGYQEEAQRIMGSKGELLIMNYYL